MRPSTEGVKDSWKTRVTDNTISTLVTEETHLKTQPIISAAFNLFSTGTFLSQVLDVIGRFY